MTNTVLVVDDEKDIGELLKDGLAQHGWAVESCLGAVEAVNRTRDADYDAIIVDVNLGDVSGIELCRKLTQNRPHVPVIMITAFGAMPSAIAAMRAGAADFVSKPLDMSFLAQSIERVIQQRHRREALERLREIHGGEASTPSSFIGESPEMLEVWQLVCRVADTDTTVLVTGESGTGKELVARALHERGRRASQPFVAINCAAVPGPLLEAELFGHVRGAFTDAKDTRSGLFEQAGSGTLFLDEIGELPLDLQPKLLRVLQERQFRPVGSNDSRPLAARVVAATNRDLERAVSERRFREDLFYRLNVVQVTLPALRARGADICLLAQHFVAKFAQQHGKQVHRLSAEAMARLSAYDWPGNVRQLENALERAVALSRTEQIALDDLPERVLRPTNNGRALDGAPTATLEQLERSHIERTLRAHKGNKTRAAKALGVDRRTLYRKLERMSFDESQR